MRHERSGSCADGKMLGSPAGFERKRRRSIGGTRLSSILPFPPGSCSDGGAGGCGPDVFRYDDFVTGAAAIELFSVDSYVEWR